MSKTNKKNKEPLEYYLALDYPITFYPEEDGGFTVSIEDLPGCVTQGDTLEEAFEMMQEARELWIEVSYDYDDPIPLPSTETQYSGKTMLRMPKYLHERLAKSAKKEETSLNQYIVSLLSERNALRAIDTLQTQIEGLQAELAQMRENGRQSDSEEAKEFAVAEEPAPYRKSSSSA